jgi:hypothetical protein
MRHHHRTLSTSQLLLLLLLLQLHNSWKSENPKKNKQKPPAPKTLNTGEKEIQV